MKFARYLEETQTPEWKKAYIDYRGLKKRITAIRRAHQAANGGARVQGTSPLLPLERASISNDSEREGRPASRRSACSDQIASRSEDVPTCEPALGFVPKKPGMPVAVTDEPAEFDSEPRLDGREGTKHSPEDLQPGSGEPSALHRAPRRNTTVAGMIGRAFSSAHIPQRAYSQRGSAGAGQGIARFDLRHPIPLMELLPLLTPVERTFFDKLNEELDKVESFYCEREREMKHRGHLLKEQLQELQDHRRAFYEAHPIAATTYSWLPLPLQSPIIPNLLIHRRNARQGRSFDQKGGKSGKHGSHDYGVGTEEARVNNASDVVVQAEIPKGAVKQIEDEGAEEDTTKVGGGSPEGTLGRSRWRTSGASKSVQALFQFHPGSSTGQKRGSDTDGEGEGGNGSSSGSPKRKSHAAHTPARYDPEEYQHAKKQLKKAVLECYRGLELLNNYRVGASIIGSSARTNGNRLLDS
ncbi:SPX domain-containing protein [Trametes meyenii]|nr:SPX domain-containing protein [Trametes meyenii]